MFKLIPIATSKIKCLFFRLHRTLMKLWWTVSFKIRKYYVMNTLVKLLRKKACAIPSIHWSRQTYTETQCK